VVPILSFDLEINKAAESTGVYVIVKVDLVRNLANEEGIIARLMG